MRHKMISIFALSLVLTLAAGVSVFAQDTTTTTGKVSNVDASAGTVTVTTAAGSTETFATDSQSMYMSNGRTIDLKTIKIGDQVTVTYRSDNGTKTATHVDVVSGTGSTTSPGAYGSDTGRTYNSPTDNNNGAAVDTYKNDTHATTSPTYDRDRSMDTTTDSQLPRTGSPLPLIGLAAGLFGAAALALAGFRRFAF